MTSIITIKGMKRKYTYDLHCFDLARFFSVDDEPASGYVSENMDELAHLIQQTVEDYISSKDHSHK